QSYITAWVGYMHGGWRVMSKGPTTAAYRHRTGRKVNTSPAWFVSVGRGRRSLPLHGYFRSMSTPVFHPALISTVIPDCSTRSYFFGSTNHLDRSTFGSAQLER